MAAVRERLDELCARHGLPADKAVQLERLLGLVEHAPVAVTAVRDPAEAVDVHIADSLAGLEVAALRAVHVIADLGAGAGFPGIPLALALPGARVTLVESVRKKCDFLERAAVEVGVENVAICCARAEEWRAGLGRHEAVTARALAPLAVLVEYAAPLLVVGGVLVAWKGRPEPEEEVDGAAAAGALGLELADVVRVEPFAGVRERRLYVYRKMRETPAGYPRRAGMARKRPLGAGRAP